MKTIQEKTQQIINKSFAEMKKTREGRIEKMSFIKRKIADKAPSSPYTQSIKHIHNT